MEVRMRLRGGVEWGRQPGVYPASAATVSPAGCRSEKAVWLWNRTYSVKRLDVFSPQMSFPV